MHPDLSKLLDLQAKDSAIAEVDARIAGVDADLAELDQELARARGIRDTAQRNSVIVPWTPIPGSLRTAPRS